MAAPQVQRLAIRASRPASRILISWYFNHALHDAVERTLVPGKPATVRERSFGGPRSEGPVLAAAPMSGNGAVPTLSAPAG